MGFAKVFLEVGQTITMSVNVKFSHDFRCAADVYHDEVRIAKNKQGIFGRVLDDVLVFRGWITCDSLKNEVTVDKYDNSFLHYFTVKRNARFPTMSTTQLDCNILFLYSYNEFDNL